MGRTSWASRVEELIIHPKVLNLSSVSLTPSHIQILSKGLKFTPTPQRKLPEMEKDTKDFTRKLRPLDFFSENPELGTPDSSLLKKKSIFCFHRNGILESVIIIFFLKKTFPRKPLKNKSKTQKIF